MDALRSTLVIRSKPSNLSSTASIANSFSQLKISSPGTGKFASFKVEAKVVPRKESRKVRHLRIRKKLNGTSERPRLSVFRSNQHLYVQIIDDSKQHTVAAISTLNPALREELKLTSGPTIEAAQRVGQEIAKIAIEKGITKVAFDRGGFVYHGRIKALADAAREAGLDF